MLFQEISTFLFSGRWPLTIMVSVWKKLQFFPALVRIQFPTLESLVRHWFTRRFCLKWAKNSRFFPLSTAFFDPKMTHQMTHQMHDELACYQHAFLQKLEKFCPLMTHVTHCVSNCYFMRTKSSVWHLMLFWGEILTNLCDCLIRTIHKKERVVKTTRVVNALNIHMRKMVKNFISVLNIWNARQSSPCAAL